MGGGPAVLPRRAIDVRRAVDALSARGADLPDGGARDGRGAGARGRDAVAGAAHETARAVGVAGAVDAMSEGGVADPAGAGARGRTRLPGDARPAQADLRTRGAVAVVQALLTPRRGAVAVRP